MCLSFAAQAQAAARAAAGEVEVEVKEEAQAAQAAQLLLGTPGGGRGARGIPVKYQTSPLVLGSPSTSRGFVRTPGTSKVPLENVVISTPSGLKFTIKADPNTLKGSKYKLAAVPLKGLSQHLKSGVLKLAPSGYGKQTASPRGSTPQQIKMKIVGGEGDGAVSNIPVQGAVLDMKDITKSAADLSGVSMLDQQGAGDILGNQTITASVVGNDTVIHVQKPTPPPPPPPAPPQQPTDQTYYQCGDCGMLFESMDAIQNHLTNDCAGAGAGNQHAQAQNPAAVANESTALPMDTLGSMEGTSTIDLAQIANPVGLAGMDASGMRTTDPMAMTNIAFDAGLQV